MKTSPKNFVVHIAKQSQKKKMEAIGSILLHPNFVKMKFYLQHGVITQIGSVAHREFPQAEVGDTLLFHHFVEDGTAQLIDTLPDGDEIRFVSGDNQQNNFQAFGAAKPDGDIIPTPNWIFLDPAIELWESGKHTSLDLKRSNPGDWDSEDQDITKLNDLDRQAKSLQESYGHLANPNVPINEKQLRELEPVETAIDQIMKERGEITRNMSLPKLAACTVLHIHPDLAEQTGIQQGSQILCDSKVLYPFDVDGNQFFLLRRTLIHGLVTE